MRKSCTQLDFVCLGGQYYGLGQSTLQALYIVYENTSEVKTGKEHYKLSYETIKVKIGSFLVSPGAKNCSKRIKNSSILVHRPFFFLFFFLAYIKKSRNLF